MDGAEGIQLQQSPSETDSARSDNMLHSETVPDIHFVRITATTMNQICDLSETLSPPQRKMVAENVRSIAEAHFSASAWMRAIYADDVPIGFIMTHTGSDYEDGIDCPGVFLWRFMIAGPYQGKGYGKLALEKLIHHLKAMGIPVLYTSCGQGEGSPEGFYRRLGFAPTGGRYGEEIELALRVDTYAWPGAAV
jgi:diamine N-acetyltransferase